MSEELSETVSAEQGESEALVEVRVMKYDGALHRRWRAHGLRRKGSLLVLDAAFEEEVRHSQLGLIRRGTVSIEYYWLDRWYNVFRFLEPDGKIRNFYCNVNMPPSFDGRVLSYIDLDVDILVSPDFSYEVLDLDEFEMNAEKYGYPADVRERVMSAIEDLQSLIEARRFPFNQSG